MNWLFIVVLVIIIIGMIRGWRRGALRILFSLISLIVLVVLMSWAVPHVNEYLRTHTNVYNRIEERCIERVEDRLDFSSPDAQEAGESLGLPSVFGNYLTGKGNVIEPVQEEITETAAQQIGTRMANIIVNVIAFVIALVIILIIIKIIGHMLKLFNKIPVLGKINQGIGLIFGGFEGLLIVWLVMLIMTFLSGTGHAQAYQMIEENVFLSFLYDHNGILYILSRFLI